MTYLQTDRRTCYEGPERALVFARREDVRLVSLDTPYRVDVILPLQGLQHAVALDIDAMTGMDPMMCCVVGGYCCVVLMCFCVVVLLL